MQRIPHEQRLCSCDHGGIQDEQHLVEHCTYISTLRQLYPHTNFNMPEIMNDKYVCEFIYRAMHKYGSLM